MLTTESLGEVLPGIESVEEGTECLVYRQEIWNSLYNLDELHTCYESLFVPTFYSCTHKGFNMKEPSFSSCTSQF